MSRRWRGLAATWRMGLVLAVLASSHVACREPQSQPRWQAAGNLTPRRGGALRFSTADSVNSLDPAIAYDEISIYMTAHLFDTLVGYAPAMPGGASGAATVLEPRLAESWQLSEDGKMLRFHLRADLRYHDGAPIVAGDFKYALERVLRMQDSPFGSFLLPVAGAEAVRQGRADHCAGIRVLDDRTLEFELTRRDASFLYILAMKFAAPLRREAAERAGAALRREPLASGPYQLVSWEEGQRVTLKRSPHHWDTRRGWLDEIVLLENVPRDVELLMFERGELDVCYQPPAPGYLWLHSQPAWRPHMQRTVMMNAFGERMNVTRPPFNDVRVRRALNYAVNKEHLAVLLHGTAEPAHGILPPGMFGRDDAIAPYPHDPGRARSLLREAGYPDGFAVEYATLTGDEPRKLATALQADLAEVGVRITIRELSLPAYLAAVGSRDGPGLSFTSWTQDYPDPSSFVDLRFHSRMITDQASINDTFYANPVVDGLIDEARGELDRTRRRDKYLSIEKILYDDAPWIWGYHRATVEVLQPYVKSYQAHPVWVRDFSYAWLDLDDKGRRVPASEVATAPASERPR